MAFQRAGISAGGRSSHLATCRTEQTQCRRVCTGRSAACSTAAMRAANDGSKRVLVGVMGTGAQVTVMDGDACVMDIGVFWEDVYSIYRRIEM